LFASTSTPKFSLKASFLIDLLNFSKLIFFMIGGFSLSIIYRVVTVMERLIKTMQSCAGWLAGNREREWAMLYT
jgi:hypothetical protein